MQNGKCPMSEIIAAPVEQPAADGAPPQLTCYQLDPRAAEIVPARGDRAWMDATDNHYAYRCLPLSMANTSGWELLCPFSFQATWNGRAGIDAITVLTRNAGADAVGAFMASHFGHGVLTFHTGWLLRTSPGWALWVRGAPNDAKEGIHALDGVVETDWLPFPFTMNWRFLRPGSVRFEKGEPFCFITLCPHAMLDSVKPRRANLDDEPALKADYAKWQESRADFNKRLREGEPEARAQKWQRGYFRGVTPQGEAPSHISRRRLQPLD